MRARQVPVAKMVSHGVGYAWYVGGENFHLPRRGKKPNFTQTALHSRRACAPRVDCKDAGLIVALENKTLTS